MTFEATPVDWGVAALPRESRLYRTLLAFDWYIIPPSSAMFRREVVEAVGGFQNPWGSDDLDFYLRVSRLYEGWLNDNATVTRYRRYSASSSRDGAPCSAACAKRTCGRCPSSGVTTACSEHGKTAGEN